LYNRLIRDEINGNEGKIGVVNLDRIGDGQFVPDLGGQYHRILHIAQNHSQIK